MASVGALVVPISADIKGLQGGLKQAGREVKGFAKSFALIEKLGAGGILGSLFGGGLGGLVGQKLDDLTGFSETMESVVKAAGQRGFNLLSGTDDKKLAAAEAAAISEAEMAKSVQKRERALHVEFTLLTKGAEAARRAELAQAGWTKEAMNGVIAAEKINAQLKVQAEWVKLTAESVRRNDELELHKQRRMFGEVRDLEREAFNLGKTPAQIRREMLDPDLAPRERDRALKAIQQIENFDKEQGMAKRIQAELGGGAFVAPALAGLRKGSSEEFSSLQKLRRELNRIEKKDPTPDEIREVRKRLEKDDAKREKQLEDIKKALKDPPIKQVWFI